MSLDWQRGTPPPVQLVASTLSVRRECECCTYLSGVLRHAGELRNGVVAGVGAVGLEPSSPGPGCSRGHHRASLTHARGVGCTDAKRECEACFVGQAHNRSNILQQPTGSLPVHRGGGVLAVNTELFAVVPRGRRPLGYLCFVPRGRRPLGYL